MMRKARSIAILVAPALLAAGLVTGPGAQAGQVLLDDAFSGPTTGAPVVGINNDTPGFPCLTAGSDTTSTPIGGCNLSAADPAGSGVLRLTDAVTGQASGVLYDTSVPTANGLVITFHQYQYGGACNGVCLSGQSGADGISFDLAAAPPQPATLGPPGGSLGYAGSFGSAGLPDGWLGIGLDVYGNFTNPGFDGSGCTDPSWAGASPNQVTVRGPGNSSTGYCLLASTASVAGGLAGMGIALHGGLGTRPDADRSVKIVIDPTGNTFSVGIDPAGGTSYQTVTSGSLPDFYFDPTTGNMVSGLPPRITFGWAASTGAATDIHEISGLTASTLTGTVPILGLTKSDDVGGVPVLGSSFDFSITPSVLSTGAAEKDAPSVTDPLPPGLLAGTPSGVSWNCSSSTPTYVSCTYTGPLPLAAGNGLPAITVPVTVGSGITPGTKLTNTATVISNDAALSVMASDTVTVTGRTACPLRKTNVRWRYTANGNAGGFSGTASCANGQVNIGPQAMDGNLIVSPGTRIIGGYDFTLPGNTTPQVIRFAGANIGFRVACVSGKRPSAAFFVLSMPDASYAVDNSQWVPSGDQQSLQQGSAITPNLCFDGPLSLAQGGTFRALISQP